LFKKSLEEKENTKFNTKNKLILELQHQNSHLNEKIATQNCLIEETERKIKKYSKESCDFNNSNNGMSQEVKNLKEEIQKKISCILSLEEKVHTLTSKIKLLNNNIETKKNNLI